MSNREIVIIGSGPAGHTAALYAARANLAPLVIEGIVPGGQLTTTTEVDNYPGFPNGLSGPQLMENMKKQAQRFEAEYISTVVTEVDLQNQPFQIKCQNGNNYKAKTIIIATGASAKYLGLPNEKELIGKGVSACATCDGFFYKNQIVHVAGGGDTAIEEASFLTKFASQVTIIHRRDQLRASKTMQEKAFNNPKIDILWDSIVEEILADNTGVIGLKIKNVKTGEITERKTGGFFLGIGHNPNTEFLKGQITLDKSGFIVPVNPPHPDTNIPGVFTCGDVQDPYYRQAISAAGSGCQAAIRAEKFLESI